MPEIDKEPLVEITNASIKKLILALCKSYGPLLPPEIVYGICMQESGMYPFAARYEPGYTYLVDPQRVKPKICSLGTEMILQKTSWGLMQVMGGVFREYGYEGWLTELLLYPSLQLQFGCRHLYNKIKKYGLDLGIASYNSGSPVYKEGRLINQEYINKVKQHAKGWEAFA